MDVAELIAHLEVRGLALADAADRAGLDAAVPTCPGWDVRALIAHTGMVHRWATRHVNEGRHAFAGNTEEPDFPAPRDGAVQWFRDGVSDLVAALRAAPDDLDATVFLADAGPPRHFWARRQAHETTVHSADAAGALGEVSDLDAGLALDGIGELLEGFYGRRGGRLLADPPLRIRVAPADVATTTWLVELGADSRTVTRDGGGPADCTLRGAAADLYLYLWNRRPARDVEVDGDNRAVEVWQSRARVRWS